MKQVLLASPRVDWRMQTAALLEPHMMQLDLVSTLEDAELLLRGQRVDLFVLDARFQGQAADASIQRILKAGPGRWINLIIGDAQRMAPLGLQVDGHQSHLLDSTTSPEQLSDVLDDFLALDSTAEPYALDELLANAMQQPATPLQDIHLLLVEHGDRIARLLQQSEVRQLSIHRCSTATEARHLIRYPQYDLILVSDDLIDGCSKRLTEWLVQQPATASARVIGCGPTPSLESSHHGDDWLDSSAPGPFLKRIRHHLYRVQAHYKQHHIHASLKRRHQREASIILRQQRRNALQSLQTELEKKNRELERLAYAPQQQSHSAVISSMMHEIRTPLTAIMGFLEQMDHAALEGDDRQWLEVARSNSQTLLNLVNELLDLGKIVASGLQAEPEPVYLREVVEQAFAPIIYKSTQKGLHLSYWIDESLPQWISSNATCLGQVLVNLLSNAVKYTEVGEIKLRVELQKNGRTHLIFRVSDSGVGIPDEHISEAFDQYTQLQNPLLLPEEGHGLGLAICQRFVRALNGELNINSGNGRGTQASLSIPLIHCPMQERQAEQATAPLLDGRQIWVIAPQDYNRDLLNLFIRRWGGQTRIFSCSDSALQRLEREAPPDLLIVDTFQLDIEVTELLRALNQGQTDIPLILLNSLGYDEGIDAPSVGTLLKPVRERPLRQLLEQFFGAVEHNDLQAPRAATASRRLLVVDDNAVNRRIIGMYLKAMGLSFETAGSGSIALNMLDKAHFDIVLMDINMPGMNGFEATRQLRSHLPAHRQPVVIALTGAVSNVSRNRCLDEGMNDFLPKPVTRSQLAAALDRVFAGFEQTGEPAPASAHTLPAAGDEPVVDTGQLQALVDEVGLDGLSQLIDLFIDDTRKNLAHYREAVDQADFETQRSDLHALKSSARYLGATPMATLAERMENAFKCGNKSWASEQSSTFFHQAERALDELGRLASSHAFAAAGREAPGTTGSD